MLGDVSERVIAQYLKTDDAEAVADSYDYYVVRNLARVPDPGQDAARRYLEAQAGKDPRVASAQVADFFDLRYIERAQASGLVQRLYGN